MNFYKKWVRTSGGGDVAKVNKKSIIVNIITFAKIDKGGGG